MIRYSDLNLRSHASIGLALCLALVVAGCGMPFGGPDYSASSTDPLVTGTVVASGVTDVDPADWKTVQDAISMSFSTLEDGGTTQWNNENTGSNGSIVPETIVETEQGMICRPFQTTLDTISGVENFSGHACRQRNGSWRITKIASTTDENGG